MFTDRPLVQRLFARVALAVMCTCASAAGAQTLTWTGAAGNGNAGTAGNWSPAVTPTTTHDLVIPAGAGTVNVNGISVRSISTASPITNFVTPECSIGTVTINGGTLELLNDTTLDVWGGCFLDQGIRFVGNCAFNGTGKIRLRQNFQPVVWVSGGALTIGSQASIVADEQSLSVPPTIKAGPNPGTIINQGTIVASAGAWIRLGSEVAGNPLLTLANTGNIRAEANGSIGIGYSFRCQTDGSLCSGETISWNNTGSLQAFGGTIYVVNRTPKSLAAHGSMVQQSGGKILLQGLPPGTVLIPRSDGDKYYLTSAVVGSSASFADLTIGAPTEIRNVASMVRLTGTLTFANNASLTSPNNPSMNGPILESISAISGTGTIINNGGIIVQGSGASIAPGADINVTGTSNIYLSGGLTNAGTLTFASGVTNAISGGIMTNTGMLRAINGTRLNVTCAFDSTGGNVVAQDNAIIDFTGLPAILGTWSTTTGGQILINGIAVDTTVFAPPEGMTFSGRTDWNNVTLSGTFTISPGAVVRIAGNLTLTPGTVINMGSGTFTNASMQFVGFSPQSILGSGEIIGAGTTASTPSISGSRQLTIGPNITIRTSTSGISVSAFDAPLINLGTLRSTVSGLRLLAQGMPFNNQGSVTIANGLATNFLGPVNSGTITIGPGTSVSIPVGQTFSQTSTGTLTFQINGPSPTINAARMPVQGSFTAGGRIRVQYVSYNPPALCRPAVMLVERLSAGASITGNFTQFTLPTSSAPIAPRVRRSDVGIYFASSIPADVAALGGNPVPDGQFSADDLIFYIDRFISGDVQLADIASLGGALGPDSQITADDIIAFLNSAFAGCP